VKNEKTYSRPRGTNLKNEKHQTKKTEFEEVAKVFEKRNFFVLFLYLEEKTR